MDNCSTNDCNASDQSGDQESPTPYIATAIFHITVVVLPTLLLGAIILRNVYVNKKMRDPITALFCYLTVLCMLSPIYGLLSDIMAITDVPILGSCSSRLRAISVVVNIFLRSFTPNQIALITCTQYLVVRYGKNILTNGRALAAFGVVMAAVLAAAILMAAPNIDALGIPAPKIRGSWCFENDVVRRNSVFQAIALTGTLFTLPVIVVVIFSVLCYLIVRRSSMEADKVTRSVLLTSAATLILEFLFKLPFVLLLVAASALNNHSLFFFSVTISELEYCFVLLLLVTVHKGIRGAVLQRCSRKPNRVMSKSGTVATSELVPSA